MFGLSMHKFSTQRKQINKIILTKSVTILKVANNLWVDCY